MPELRILRPRMHTLRYLSSDLRKVLAHPHTEISTVSDPRTCRLVPRLTDPLTRAASRRRAAPRLLAAARVRIEICNLPCQSGDQSGAGRERRGPAKVAEGGLR